MKKTKPSPLCRSSSSPRNHFSILNFGIGTNFLVGLPSASLPVFFSISLPCILPRMAPNDTDTSAGLSLTAALIASVGGRSRDQMANIRLAEESGRGEVCRAGKDRYRRLSAFQSNNELVMRRLRAG